MFTIDLKNNNNRPCSIWIDPTKFPLPPHTDVDNIGLINDQIHFINTQVFSENYFQKSYTTLYYLYCSMRVDHVIPKTFARVLSLKCPYIAMEISVEEAFEPPVVPKFDTTPYRTLKPDSVVVSFPFIHSFNTNEKITVHRDLKTKKMFIQYKYKNDHNYPLVSRINRLLKYHSNFTVTNATIREMFNIPTTE